MPATLEELEARVAALEAERADYRAVLAAVNALGAIQREQAEHPSALERRLASMDDTLADTNARVRSVEDSLTDVKDLLIQALGQ